MKNIVFIYGVYHGTWCWDEKFLRVFKDKGYTTHCPDLRIVSKEEKQDTLLQSYVENLFRLVKKIGNRTVLVVHSAYSIVVFEYLKKYPNTVGAVIFISPFPVRLEFLRALNSGIRQLRLGLRSVLFSNRLSDHMADEYLQKLYAEESGFTIETSRNHWNKKKKIPVIALFIGSNNDNCIKANWVKETAKRLGCSCIIYNDICHNMMLDPSAQEVARDMVHFIENIKGKEINNYGETRTVC